MTDRELLDKYVVENSREALGALMQRHVGMVNAAAMREVSDASLADDITQAVFLVLMRRAKNLSARVRIGGWLFKVTRYAASDARKREARRTRHEREASKMANAQPQETHWSEIEPALNDAIASLGKADRDLIIMRYLEGRSVREIAETEHATENAMRQRIMRALQRLKKKLAKCGVAGSAAAVGTVLETKAVHGALRGMVATISATIAGTHVPSGLCNAIAKGVLQMMRNMKIAAFTATAALSLLLLVAGYVGLRTTLANRTNVVSSSVATIQPTPATTPVQPAIAKSPTEALRAAYQLAMAGDADALVAACDGLTDQQVAMLKKIAPAMKAVNDLEQAISAKYGADARAALETAMVGMNPADLDKATEKVNGDRATVNIGRSGPGNVVMVRVNGQWKVSAATISSMPAQMADLAEKMTPVLRGITANINAGKYANINELQQAMAKIMQQGGQRRLPRSTTVPDATSRPGNPS